MDAASVVVPRKGPTQQALSPPISSREKKGTRQVSLRGSEAYASDVTPRVTAQREVVPERLPPTIRLESQRD